MVLTIYPRSTSIPPSTKHLEEKVNIVPDHTLPNKYLKKIRILIPDKRGSDLKRAIEAREVFHDCLW